MTSTTGLIGNLGQTNYSAAKLRISALSKSIASDMARFHVRSNCIAPFAWSQMTSSIPVDSPEAEARVAKLKRMEAHKIAPLVVRAEERRVGRESGGGSQEGGGHVGSRG